MAVMVHQALLSCYNRFVDRPEDKILEQLEEINEVILRINRRCDNMLTELENDIRTMLDSIKDEDEDYRMNITVEFSVLELLMGNVTIAIDVVYQKVENMKSTNEFVLPDSKMDNVTEVIDAFSAKDQCTNMIIKSYKTSLDLGKALTRRTKEFRNTTKNEKLVTKFRQLFEKKEEEGSCKKFF